MARKSSTTIRISEKSRNELRELADQLRISQAAVMEFAIHRLYEREVTPMNKQQLVSLQASGIAHTLQQANQYLRAAKSKVPEVHRIDFCTSIRFVDLEYEWHLILK